ncbi:MAG: sigma-70 family RNA polymerase sigma factor [Verrucomicrobia bacterium]|nr:sigma-70 family RNA polymerase sigma factor [Verrucomicrobiota bacterium]
MSEVTRMLDAIQQGDPKAAEDLLPLVYNELRKLAVHKMAQEAPGQTLQATALVHEAWLRIAGGDTKAWDGRRHFFAAAAEAMRRILVEAARRKKRLRHGGGLERVEVEAMDLPAPMPDDELLALDEALTRLAEVNPQGAEVVKLCFFVGLTQEQAAKELGVSVSTVERLWAYSRAWLFRAMRQGSPPNPSG